MPKRQIVASTEYTSDWAGLAGWQAAGLSLAVAGPAIFGGLGTLVGAVLLTPVIFALVRLRTYASTARATGDLVGSTLGGRAAAFTGALQVVAYTLLALAMGQAVGFGSSFWLSDGDPAATDSWLWPLLSVAAVALAGLAVHFLSDRTVGSVVAVLVAMGLLIPFYLALAVLARVYAGTEPVEMSGDGPLTGLDIVSSLLLSALVLVGFEVVTARNQLIRSAGRRMGFAVVITTVFADVIWLADRLGSTGGLRLGVEKFPVVVVEFYDIAGAHWLMAAGIAAMSAALLALMWAVTKVGARLADRVPIGAITAASVGATGLLIIACCRNWGLLPEKLSHVAGIVLVAVYVLIVEASSRIPGDGAVAWWLRLVMPAVLAAVVLLPLVNTDFAMTLLWPVLISAVLVALCYAAARLVTASRSSSG